MRRSARISTVRPVRQPVNLRRPRTAASWIDAFVNRSKSTLQTKCSARASAAAAFRFTVATPDPRRLRACSRPNRASKLAAYACKAIPEDRGVAGIPRAVWPEVGGGARASMCVVLVMPRVRYSLVLRRVAKNKFRARSQPNEHRAR